MGNYAGGFLIHPKDIGLECAFTAQDRNYSFDKDIHIQEQRMVMDIIQIILRVQVHRIIAPAIHLPPSG
jgi:hypothetical protein